MKLRKAIKIAATGAVAAALPGVASAAIPSLTSWELVGDKITYTCPVGSKCATAPIEDAGFYQVAVVDELGDEYIVTINAEAQGALVGATTFGNLGDFGFADANVIKLGVGTDGIQSRSEIVETDGIDKSFTSAAQIAAGFAETEGVLGSTQVGPTLEKNRIILNQGVVDNDTVDDAQTYNHSFAYTGGNNTNADYNTGQWGISTLTSTMDDGLNTFDGSFELKQLAYNNITTGANTNAASDNEYKQIIQTATLTDPTVTQVFDMKELSGTAGLTAGVSIDLAGLNLGFLGATVSDTDTQFATVRVDQTGSTGTFGIQQLSKSDSVFESFDSLVETGPYYTYTPDPFNK